MLDTAAGQIHSIGEVIRQAVAPVFLLTGVGTMLMVLTNRLARAVDRARQLESRRAEGVAGTTTTADGLREPLRVLARRAQLLSYAIALLTVCALLVSMVIVTLFLGAFFDFGIVRTIGALFILAMVAFVSALLCFLREVFMATASMRSGIRR
jgi:hypothetical protein